MDETLTRVSIGIDKDCRAGNKEKGTSNNMEWKRPEAGWLVSVLGKICSGDHQAEAELCEFLSPGLRLLAQRRSTIQDAEDLTQEALVVVLAAARAGNIRTAESVGAFGRSVIWNLATRRIEDIAKTRSWLTSEDLINMPSPQFTPEQALVEDGRVLASRVLAEMKPQQREILRRFYLNEEPPEQICQEMGLSSSRFRLLKSRAKARFGQLGRQQLMSKSPRATVLKTSTSRIRLTA